MSSMKRLVAKIIDQFSHEAIIEIYVLDELGKPFELYSGMPSGLTSKFFVEVLNKPSTFYCFSVVGIDETFADLLDIHRDKMSRKEFCWLTDPIPPTLVKRSATSISLAWDLVDFCGVDVSVVEDSMEYVLEGCMGQAWTTGIASKFVSDIANPEYKVLARGSKLSEVVVNDLQPSQWYHFRLCLRYRGTWLVSESRPFATLCARPSKPKQPSVYLIMNGNDMFLDRNRVDPLIRLCWGPPNKNGSEINKYQVQVREYFEEEEAEDGTGTQTEESEVFDETGAVDDDDVTNVRTDEAGHKMVGNKWHTSYCNLLTQVVLPQPSKTCVAWACRLRAQNAHGWSDFCDPLVLDCDSHPVLFPPEEPPPVSPRLLPPLESSRLDSSRGDSSRQSSVRRSTSKRDSGSWLDSQQSKTTTSATQDISSAPNLLLPPGSPAFRYELNPEHDRHWLQKFPDRKMSSVLDPDVDKLWAWTNINKDFIRYVVASAVCETVEYEESTV